MLQGTLLSFARRIRHGRLTLILPSGQSHRFVGDGAGPDATLKILRWRFFPRFFLRGANGFAEAYLAGECDTPDLSALLYLAAVNQDELQEGLNGSRLARLSDRLGHRLRPNSKRGSKRNILAHYDLGNDFYGLWLDPTLTYSSAVFPRPEATLQEAQEHKYRLICEAADIRPDQEVLEIGCGWGGFASYAAKVRQAKVTAVTISDAQFQAAAARVQKEGLGERVRIEKRDYRDLNGKFDRLASIEMFEAVGEAYWPAYFRKAKEVLRPGGRAALQVITIADKAFDRYRQGADFIQRHVFPGGMLPSSEVLKREAAQAGFAWQNDAGFASHYATTLKLWREAFEAAWGKIQTLGFDERFRRLWRYYLAYCEAGFRSGRIDVKQISLAC